MNKHAVVLAADSATTVSQWTEEGRETRYFKGANKIFQLSESRPVGIMIYDSADIMSVPWETVIKTFRAELGNKSFNDLDGYKNEFFSFLAEDRRLFPDEIRVEVLVEAIVRAALGPVFESEDPPAGAERTAFLEALLQDIEEELAELQYVGSFSDAHAEAISQAHGAEIDEEISGLLEALKASEIVSVERLRALGISLILKKSENHLDTTGLVFAGFGDHSVFPSHISCISCGLVLGEHVVTSTSHEVVDHKKPASLRAFAQTSMSETFTLGLSKDVYGSMIASLFDEFNAFAEKLCEAAGVDKDGIDNLAELVQEARRNVGQTLLNEASKAHAIPLRRVIGVLPIDEMAELAETLVSLQSLKEKVTKPSETVGGPVDVAVITKSEGLVWLKRKHYFDLSLNPRFVKRLGN